MEYVVTRYMFKDTGKINGKTAIVITPKCEFKLPKENRDHYWTASVVHKSYELAIKARNFMLSTNKMRGYKLIQLGQQ